MKKIILTLTIIMATLTASAYDYPYLTFQDSDGALQSVSVESLSLTVSGGQLLVTNTATSKTYTLAQLCKMYFSTEDVTGIISVENTTANDGAQLYDLQGRRVQNADLKAGVYIIKTNKGTRKVNIR